MTSQAIRKVNALVHEQGRSYAWLAKQAGISYVQLNRILNGSSGGSVSVWLKIFDALGLELTVEEKPPAMDAETSAWHDADLSRLGEFPYDWGDTDPETLGTPVTYVPGEGLMVIAGADDSARPLVTTPDEE